MRKIFSIAAAGLFLLTGSAFAQAPSSVTGTVKDNAGKLLQSVTVSLLNAADSSLVKTDVTDSKGSFEISTSKEGSFLLLYSSVGYDQQYSAVFEKKQQQTSECRSCDACTVYRQIEGSNHRGEKTHDRSESRQNCF